MDQMEMISLDQLVPTTHRYRKFLEIWSFKGKLQAAIIRFKLGFEP